MEEILLQMKGFLGSEANFGYARGSGLVRGWRPVEAAAGKDLQKEANPIFEHGRHGQAASAPGGEYASLGVRAAIPTYNSREVEF